MDIGGRIRDRGWASRPVTMIKYTQGSHWLDESQGLLLCKPMGRNVPWLLEISAFRCSTPTTISTRRSDALTKYLPEAHKHAIDFVDVHGRTKIMVRGQISNYIPNPTFDRIGRPGAQEEYFKSGNPEGKSYREIIGRGIDCPRPSVRPVLASPSWMSRASTSR